MQKEPYDYEAARLREIGRKREEARLDATRMRTLKLVEATQKLANAEHVHDMVTRAFAELSRDKAPDTTPAIQATGGSTNNPPPSDCAGVDTEQLFQLFAIYSGDVERTALAAGLAKEVVTEQALINGWADKLKILIDLRTSARPGDSERGVNRALNFIQAHRYRNLLQRIMHKLMAMPPEDLNDMVCVVEVDKAGNISKKLTTRPFADLASALEKCHAMTYAALNDTVGERRERSEEPESQHKSAAELHLQITRAMEEVRATSVQLSTTQPPASLP